MLERSILEKASWHHPCYRSFNLRATNGRIAMKDIFFEFLAAVVVSALVSPALGQAPESTTVDERTQIEAVVASYVAAFNERNTEGLVSHWSPEGVYTSRATGEQVIGRDAIGAEFNAIFTAGESPTLAVNTDSIEFISPNVALERGTATVVSSEEDVTETKYSVVYVKRDGEWLIDHVAEDEATSLGSQHEHLKALEPLVGEWRHDGEEFTVEVACRWTKNQNYLSRTYKLIGKQDGEVESSGLQIIGWDPKAQEIHSWLFDSDGGFVSGTWNKRDSAWVVASVATLADGGSGSFTTILRPLEDGSLAWQKVNQVLDGQLLPNLDEIVFVRQ